MSSRSSLSRDLKDELFSECITTEGFQEGIGDRGMTTSRAKEVCDLPIPETRNQLPRCAGFEGWKMGRQCAACSPGGNLQLFYPAELTTGHHPCSSEFGGFGHRNTDLGPEYNGRASLDFNPSSLSAS